MAYLEMRDDRSRQSTYNVEPNDKTWGDMQTEREEGYHDMADKEATCYSWSICIDHNTIKEATGKDMTLKRPALKRVHEVAQQGWGALFPDCCRQNCLFKRCVGGPNTKLNVLHVSQPLFVLLQFVGLLLFFYFSAWSQGGSDEAIAVIGITIMILSASSVFLAYIGFVARGIKSHENLNVELDEMTVELKDSTLKEEDLVSDAGDLTKMQLSHLAAAREIAMRLGRVRKKFNKMLNGIDDLKESADLLTYLLEEDHLSKGNTGKQSKFDGKIQWEEFKKLVDNPKLRKTDTDKNDLYEKIIFMERDLGEANKSKHVEDLSFQQVITCVEFIGYRMDHTEIDSENRYSELTMSKLKAAKRTKEEQDKDAWGVLYEYKLKFIDDNDTNPGEGPFEVFIRDLAAHLEKKKITTVDAWTNFWNEEMSKADEKFLTKKRQTNRKQGLHDWYTEQDITDIVAIILNKKDHPPVDKVLNTPKERSDY